MKKICNSQNHQKTLKNRFSSYLSGVLNPETEIMNLPRFCYESPSPRLPKHPSLSLLADSDGIEDLTPHTSGAHQNKKAIAIGTNLRFGTKVHIPGVDVLDMNTITVLGVP